MVELGGVGKEVAGREDTEDSLAGGRAGKFEGDIGFAEEGNRVEEVGAEPVEERILGVEEHTTGVVVRKLVAVEAEEL